MDTDFMSRKSKHSLCYPLRIILDSILHKLCFLLKKGVFTKTGSRLSYLVTVFCPEDR